MIHGFKPRILMVYHWALMRPMVAAILLSFIDNFIMAAWIFYVFYIKIQYYKKFNVLNIFRNHILSTTAGIFFVLPSIYLIFFSSPPRSFYSENACQFIEAQFPAGRSFGIFDHEDDFVARGEFIVNFYAQPWPNTVMDSIWFSPQQVVEGSIFFQTLSSVDKIGADQIEEIGVSGGWQPRFLYIKVKGELFRRYQGHISYNCIQKLKEYAKKTGYADKFKLP